MASINLNNGNGYFYDSDEINDLINDCEANGYTLDYYWDVIVNAMDDDTRESVHGDLAPCSNAEFLAEYLRRADHDLIIG